MLIPLTQSLWTICPCSDRVAVLLLFLPFSTILPCLDTHLALKLCLFSAKLVCFIYFFTFNLVLGLFHTSGGPKSPGWRVYSPHYLHKLSNEAAQCPTPNKDEYNASAIDGDDNPHPCPATASNMWPILIPMYPLSPTLTSGSIAADHDFCTPQECVVHPGIQYQLPSQLRRDHGRRNGPWQ